MAATIFLCWTAAAVVGCWLWSRMPNNVKDDDWWDQ